MSRLCLGLDSSTQSLTALVLDLDATPRSDERLTMTVRFDEELPHWGTSDGQLPSADTTIGVAPPRMWLEALDVLLQRLSERVDLAALKAIAVAGQQHGTVYLRARAARDLAELSAEQPLQTSLEHSFSRVVSPIWTDSSTTAQCSAIRTSLGGAEAAAGLTGSDVYERFSGPQIRKFAEESPDGWADTAHVALVSSFLTSVLAGQIAPLDWGDAAGTNLLHLRERRWSRRALQATAPDLARRLPELAPAATPFGQIAAPLANRFGISASALVVVGTGDNPASSLGVGLLSPGDTTISLGTSDTLASLGSELPPLEGGHLFVAPTGWDLALLCFRNGSLTREHVRDTAVIKGWDGFERAVAQVPPGNEGHCLLPWLEPEIVPRTRGTGIVTSPGFPERSAPHLCRGVLEGQALSMKRHAHSLGPIRRILLTGGASASEAMPQILADVFACPVVRSESPHGAALGAALMAAQPLLDERVWKELVQEQTTSASPNTWHPSDERTAAYADTLAAQQQLEQSALATRSARSSS